MHQQQTLHIKYSLKDGNQSSILFHFVWIKALSCQIWIKDKYKFYEPVRSQRCINEFFIPDGELFPLNHLPLTSAGQNDCEAEENSTVRPSHVGERPTQTKLTYNQKLVHLSAILLCLATEQPLKWWTADQYPDYQSTPPRCFPNNRGCKSGISNFFPVKICCLPPVIVFGPRLP